LAGGLEPKLSAAVDVMFPPALFTAAVVAFQQRFPSTLLNFDVESSAVVEPVLNGRCGVGVVGSWSIAPPQLTYERLLTVRVPIVVSPQHPLAKHRGPIPAAVYAKHVFLTHVDPADISQAQGFIPKPRLWRLSHLETKLAFLRAGLGYAGMPLHMIEADLASGELVQIRLEDSPADGYVIGMSAIYRTDSPPGPAGRWFIDYLKQEDTSRQKEKAAALPPSTARLQNSSSRRSLARKGKRVVLRQRGG
jgi:DNA-binding transcriptional LysR family regulator